MNKPVRVRFAPSPTGYPHVGNIRTAMFNWLLARHTGGKLVLRIEDTDVARRVEGAVETIIDGLKWMGLDWDEGPDVGGDYGPYYQSQRLELYRQSAEHLISQGDAYCCYCSPERLEEMRAEQVRRKQPPGYDRLCRGLSTREQSQRETEGITPVVRFKTPLEGQTKYHDLIWENVVFENNIIDDFVLLKSDGYPTYHLASVVDDHAMKISHVIRAEEWISSTPRHLLLYQSLELESPQYIHHPMILGPDRAKLSKRHGAVSILDYREQGYLPETMFNFLALIGWSLDDKTDIISRHELVKNFTLERIGKTGAIFNQDKLDWMNGAYIRGLSPKDFVQRVMPFLERDLPSEIKRPLDIDYVRKIMPLVQERAHTLADVAQLTKFFFADDLDYKEHPPIGKDMDAAASAKALKAAMQKIEPLPAFNEEALETAFRQLAEELELKTGQLFGTLRIAGTAQIAAPPLFQTMVVLGRERCLQRIKAALATLPN